MGVKIPWRYLFMSIFLTFSTWLALIFDIWVLVSIDWKQAAFVCKFGMFWVYVCSGMISEFWLAYKSTNANPSIIVEIMKGVSIISNAVMAIGSIQSRFDQFLISLMQTTFYTSLVWYRLCRIDEDRSYGLQNPFLRTKLVDSDKFRIGVCLYIIIFPILGKLCRPKITYDRKCISEWISIYTVQSGTSIRNKRGLSSG